MVTVCDCYYCCPWSGMWANQSGECFLHQDLSANNRPAPNHWHNHITCFLSHITDHYIWCNFFRTIIWLHSWLVLVSSHLPCPQQFSNVWKQTHFLITLPCSHCCFINVFIYIEMMSFYGYSETFHLDPMTKTRPKVKQ